MRLFLSTVILSASLLTAFPGCDDKDAPPGGAGQGGSAGESGSGQAGASGEAGRSGEAGSTGAGGEGGLSGAGGQGGSSGVGGQAGEAGKGGEGGGSLCLSLSVDSAWNPLQADSVIFGYGTENVTPNVMAPLGRSEFRVELYGLRYGLPPIEPGSYNLAEEPSYDTCQHCVTLYGYDVEGEHVKTFFQSGGALTLDVVEDPPTTEASGKIEGLTLVEVEENGSSWSPVPGGVCLTLSTVEFTSSP